MKKEGRLLDKVFIPAMFIAGFVLIALLDKDPGSAVALLPNTFIF